MKIRKMKTAIEDVSERAVSARLSNATQNDARAAAPRREIPKLAGRLWLPNTMEDRVGKVLEMVGSATTFTVRDLALELQLSPSHLQRLFKHQTGVSIGEWLIEQRLQRAADLLAHSYMSVKEIAHSVGYEHASSFVRAFGRRFLQAPTHFRKLCHVAKC